MSTTHSGVRFIRTHALPAAIAVLSAVPVEAQRTTASGVPTPLAMSRIREQDLRRDLFLLAGDSMRGREAGTLDEMHASMWIADQLRSIGIRPAGDNGTYFQWWSMRRTRLSTSSVIRVGERAFTLWSDIAASAVTEADIASRTVWAGDGRDTSIDVRGKVAVAELSPPANPPRPTSPNTAEYRYARAAMTAEGAALARRGAAAVILIADTTAEKAFDGVIAVAGRGAYGVEGLATGRAAGAGGGRAGVAGGGRGGAGGRGGGQPNVPVLLVHRELLDELRVADKPVTIRLVAEHFTYPSVNIIGRVTGTDPKLRDEYVLFSSHQDHDGVRYSIAGDSIWNGADDNGSTSVALLAIARAWVQQPGKRSALFVYHGAEERGLLGSNYHAAFPVVPLGQIVAVLNGDLIGRNNPDSASLLGIQPPHRNSTALVQMALEANSRTGKFLLDSTWDRPTHPEGWYFRSDHLPYARLNVPALMYSTNLHPDYHTPRDEPSRIDYAKLTRMTKWMYLTGWIVANSKDRPAIDPGFKLER
jgi:peptidase M28-like protein